jgi:hypothetical protein
MNESMNMRGSLTLQITDAEGRVLHEQQYHNRIVKTGRELVAKLFAGVSTGAPPTRVTHMAVGTDPTPPADNQTGLLAERAPRKEILPADVTYTEFDEPMEGTEAGRRASVRRVRASLKAVFDFTEANGAEPLREAGIFTALTGGVMYNRVVFDAVTKTSAFKLTLLWDITF